jgi:hypothetical protein
MEYCSVRDATVEEILDVFLKKIKAQKRKIKLRRKANDEITNKSVPVDFQSIFY